MGLTRATHAPTRRKNEECPKCGKRGIGKWTTNVSFTTSRVRDCRYCHHAERQVLQDDFRTWEDAS